MRRGWRLRFLKRFSDYCGGFSTLYGSCSERFLFLFLIVAVLEEGLRQFKGQHVM